MPDPAQNEPAKPVAPTDAEGSGSVPWYLWPNLLSLDAAAVAVVWLWCFSVSLKVPIFPVIYVILGLVVWLVYTVDRLLDAIRMKDFQRATPRHRFSKRYFGILLLLAAIGLAVAILLILFRLPIALIYHGMLISLMTILYFVLRCSPQSPLHFVMPKELFCGVVFALGSTYVVHALPNNFVDGVLSAEVGVFALLCALNCTAISCWEWREDAANDSSNIVRHWPAVRGSYVKFAFVLAVVSVWLGFRNVGDFAAPILISVGASAALIGVVGMLERSMSRNALRILADLALLTPLVVVPLMR